MRCKWMTQSQEFSVGLCVRVMHTTRVSSAQHPETFLGRQGKEIIHRKAVGSLWRCQHPEEPKLE
jgi:hypothetical protein